MKTIFFFTISAIFVTVNADSKLTCKLPPQEIPREWITMVQSCTDKVKKQIVEEAKASMTYLAMGAHFSRDKINRPGFAKMFFKAASEEREHAIKLIHYLLMRGDLLKGIKPITDILQKPENTTWADGLQALNEALSLEAKVTTLIVDIIKECETPLNRVGQDGNDYHLVDYLTNDFLEEQYRGQRDIAGKASTLGKMIQNHGALGEFMFDKKLLNGEL